MKIRLIKAKSILNKSKIGDGLTLNPYIGCPHQCLYCYNQEFWQRFKKFPEKWGNFLNVKINAPEILAKELKKYQQKSLFKAKKPSVFLSTATDCYNIYEKKYQITRKCLEILLKYCFSASILTKSGLVLRDLDLFKKYKNQVEIGLTITTLDKKVQKILEPGASSPLERLKTLAKLHENGLKTYAFIGPILPYFTQIDKILANLKGKVNEIWFDDFNTRGKNWENIEKALKKHYPRILAQYKQIFFKQKKEYQTKLREKIANLSQKYQIPVKIYF